MLKLSDFEYNLPKELIAQYPAKERGSSRLMVLSRKEGAIKHGIFEEITGYLRAGDLLVLNDTKVMPARILGARVTGGQVEVLLLEHKGGMVFNALVKPARVKLNEKIIFSNAGLSARLTAKNEVTFNNTESPEKIYDYGSIPLPPYIKRKPEESDSVYYQTVYARHNGSIAAPTAGLHFTKELLEKIRCLGINLAYITLHVGYSTFSPVKTEDITKHQMGFERFSLPEDTVRLIDSTRAQGGRIFAVGTTSLRALETYVLGVKEGQTDLFIYPGYKFRITDGFLTNFHLPRTTLFMLACAFGKENFVKRAYQEAIEKKYRFYSYGDAMLMI